MDDKSYNELKLKATICPELERWPAPKYAHWEKLHSLVGEARQRASKALAQLDEVDANSDLTPEGKAKERTRLAQRALADFHKSDTLENARAAVSQMQQRWATKVNEAIVPATDYGTAVVHAQIRDRISNLEEKNRLGFAVAHIDDPAVISAILTAPEFLSGLSSVEIGVLKQKVAQRALSPEVAEAQADTTKALAAAERGWLAATRLIAERGGLQPSKAKAA